MAIAISKSAKTFVSPSSKSWNDSENHYLEMQHKIQISNGFITMTAANTYFACIKRENLCGNRYDLLRQSPSDLNTNHLELLVQLHYHLT